jgi:hypothetical protein
MTAFTTTFPPQEDLPPGQEIVTVRFEDGRVEDLRLHDYERMYAVKGLYEEVVQRRLDCRSPERLASMLARATARVGWPLSATRVFDIGAGNGVSGEALAGHGLRPVLGLDILPAARDAALRDRPGLYDAYLTADLLALTSEEQLTIRALAPNALACVGAIGSNHVPPAALAAAIDLLADDALIVYAHALPRATAVAVAMPPATELVGAARSVQEIERRRYRHRFTVSRRPIHWEAVVLRAQRR